MMIYFGYESQWQFGARSSAQGSMPANSKGGHQTALFCLTLGLLLAAMSFDQWERESQTASAHDLSYPGFS